MINLILSVEEASQTAERATKNIVNAYWFSHAFFNDCFEHLVPGIKVIPAFILEA